MSHAPDKSNFKTRLLGPKASGSDTSWAFVVLPELVSEPFSRRGRTTAAVTINGHSFQAMLEPDGQLSHWLRIDAGVLDAAGLRIGDEAQITVVPAGQEAEPELPPELKAALDANPEARATWDATTTIARIDWIHWLTSGKQAKTRTKRLKDACEMLASGKGRVCCFDPSGYYSKAFSAPRARD